VAGTSRLLRSRATEMKAVRINGPASDGLHQGSSAGAKSYFQEMLSAA
jgi:hypothetical protein